MDRFRAAFVGVFLAATCLDMMAFADTVPKKKPLNVLFLMADDLNNDLGTYGVKQMKTPNIDKLAARGVRFDRAYCQFPLCSPSRSSLLTGRRPNVTGVHTNPQKSGSLSPHFREKIVDTVSLPQAFKNNGWFSVRIGKLYHYGVPADIGTSSADDYVSWDAVINPRGRDVEHLDRVFSLRPGNFGGSLSWLRDDEGTDSEHTDGIGATEAIKMLEKFRRDARPFFLAVGFYRPHTPYIAPKKYFDLYPKTSIESPKLSEDDRARIPAAAYKSVKPEQDRASAEQKQEAVQAYHASVSFVDAQVGRILKALTRLGLADNTVIVFTSDHGYHLGDHGLWQKMSLFERSTRVPLIVAVPGKKANGKSAGGVVELVDLYPTLADLAGIPKPGYLDGMSLVPVLDDASAVVKNAAFSQTGQHAENMAVRSGPWRYMEFGVGGKDGRLLFDEEADPGETKNLAALPQHANTVKQLSALLAREREYK